MRAFVVLFVCFLQVACSKHESNSLGAVEASKHSLKTILKLCPSFAETGKPALVYGAQCGELRVKENPDDINSREISLNILRLPAISPAPKQDPLFLIQGGPGGSSVDMAAMLHSYFADVRKNRDLVFVDQRGTGKSNPMTCESLNEEDQLLSVNDQQEKKIDLIKKCAEKYQAQVQFYITPYAAKDLDAVRQALHYEKINLWGVSYGTRVALEYMREFPQFVRTSILDGVAPVQIALPKYFQEDALAALIAVNNECQSQLKCKSYYGDIVKKAEVITQRLKNAEAVHAPIKIQFEHPRTQLLNDFVLTSKNFAQLIFMSLYSRDLTVLLPRAIADAEKSDYRLIASLSALALEQSSFTGIADAMRYTVICNEDAQFITADDVVNAKSFLGLNMMQEQHEVCALWPKVNLPDYYNLPIKSDVPTLLLSGAHDPVTPSRWANSEASHLTHSLSLIAAGGNHSISMEGCVPQIITQVVESGGIANINSDCVKTIVPLPLLLGANEKKIKASSSGAAHHD